MKDFVKMTFIGGILFLLPLAVVLLLLGHVLGLATKVVQPVSHSLELDKLGTVAGMGAGTALALLALILVSFAAGMLARTAAGERMSTWVENSLVGGMPQYRMVKSMAQGFAHIEDSHDLKPALINIEEAWQIGYVLEPIAEGWVAVFLPAAPTPMSGTIMYFPVERVRALDMTMVQATTLVTRIGIGSGEALRGVDLTLPTAR